jgi:glycosyltransferase involved in cell wall biosynthesis
MRVAFATNCILPYRYATFRHLSENPSLTICIYVSMPLEASSDLAISHLHLERPLTLNVSKRTRHVEAGTRQKELVPLPIGLIWSLVGFRPNVIVSGDFGPRSLLCWVVARVLGARFLIWSEEIQSSARGRSALQRALRRVLLPRADGFLAWGEPARDYLLSHGVEVGRISAVPQSIDLDDWNRLRPQQSRSSLRTELGLSTITFLLVGRLVERKGFDRFLKAWSALPSSLASRATALIVGAGELESELPALSLRLGARNVVFKGNLSSSELARYYTACDVFVFPSLEDVWGMVVNEALLFGLPVLGSIHAGAVQQLVHDKDTGQVFDPNDIPEFTRLLERWIQQTPSISRETCRATAELQSPAAGAEAIAARLLQQRPT